MKNPVLPVSKHWNMATSDQAQIWKGCTRGTVISRGSFALDRERTTQRSTPTFLLMSCEGSSAKRNETAAGLLLAMRARVRSQERTEDGVAKVEVGRSQSQVRQHVVRDGVGDVASVKLESAEHDAGEDFRKESGSAQSSRTASEQGDAPVTFQSHLRMTAFSSASVQVAVASNRCALSQVVGGI